MCNVFACAVYKHVACPRLAQPWDGCKPLAGRLREIREADVTVVGTATLV